MIISFFEAAGGQLQELIKLTTNINLINFALFLIGPILIKTGINKALQSSGLSRRAAKKWTDRISAAVDVVQNVDLNKK